MTTSPRAGPLFVDLYELTMAAGYHAHRLNPPATFSLFIRNYPANRNYFVAAGLEDVLNELDELRFTAEDISYLQGTGLFRKEFLRSLESFRFSGDVLALPEGTLFFAGEPILEVTAPLIEAQILETFVLNAVGLQTMIASKAARCVQAAGGRPLIDFSLRRTQGFDAGMKVARSTFITGFEATSNVLAGKTYGIPTSGTMAHSFVQAFGDDRRAFAAFAEVFPDGSVFLIDTFDTREGALQAVDVAMEMRRKGAIPVGVRLDSGNMIALSRQVRKILDEAGLEGVKIFASSGFDEYKIAEVISGGALIDAFGVGTNVGVSADAPYLDIVYKLVRCNGRDVRKWSTGKATLAGEKQVFRITGGGGSYLRDLIGLREESVGGATPLLEPVMQGGRILRPHPSLAQIRERFQREFAALDAGYKTLEADQKYPVDVTPRLKRLQENP